jgi:hypothetical protein
LACFSGLLREGKIETLWFVFAPTSQVVVRRRSAMLSPMAMSTTRGQIGTHLREWRRRRRYSQLDLAQAAEISPRHLGFAVMRRQTHDESAYDACSAVWLSCLCFGLWLEPAVSAPNGRKKYDQEFVESARNN